MNSNLIHNILNLAGVVVGSLVAFDWTSLGLAPAAAATVAGGLLTAQSLIKLGINVSRDGLSGLVQPQPPVQK